MADFWGQMTVLTDAARAAEDAKAAGIQDVKMRLANGETTGDALTDYVLRNFGYQPDTLGRLRRLDRQLKEHVGDLILIVMHDEESSGCSGFGGTLSYSRVEWLNLATIKPGGLQFTTTERGGVVLDLPIGRQTSYETTRYRDQEIRVFSSSREVGNFLDRVMDCLPIWIDLPISYRESRWSVSSRPEMRIECFMGLEAIRNWFEYDVDAIMRFRRRPPGELLIEMINALEGSTVTPVP
jgi:hypothetical protein